MKKWIWIAAVVVVLAAVFLVWYSNRAPQATATASPSPAAHDYTQEVDALLVEYEQIVTTYKADTAAKNTAAVSADEAKLAEVSTTLSDLATKFSPQELEKFNAITATLGNE